MLKGIFQVEMKKHCDIKTYKSIYNIMVKVNIQSKLENSNSVIEWVC